MAIQKAAKQATPTISKEYQKALIAPNVSPRQRAKIPMMHNAIPEITSPNLKIIEIIRKK